MRTSKAEYKAILQKIADRMKRYKHNDGNCKLCEIASHIRNLHRRKCCYCIIYFLYPEHWHLYLPCLGFQVGNMTFNNKHTARIIENDVIPRLDAVPADDPFFTGVPNE